MLRHGKAWVHIRRKKVPAGRGGGAQTSEVEKARSVRKKEGGETDLPLIPTLCSKCVDAQTLHAVAVELALVHISIGKVVQAVTDLEACLTIGALVDISICQLSHLPCNPAKFDSSRMTYMKQYGDCKRKISNRSCCRQGQQSHT